MKNIFILFLLLSNSICFSQVINHKQLEGIDKKPHGTFEAYISRNGDVYVVGDTLQIKNPSGVNGKFIYITKVDISGTQREVDRYSANTKARIKKIAVGGTKNSGFKVSFQTTGMTGIDNYFFFIEDAIMNGEVKSKSLTSDEALDELKKAKLKLDLELITREEYNKIKERLGKYID
ncbi:MAG: hypothetical protein H7A23_26470 [Leptospiraceae bacterium]|nr:hypothetical protein [Leptospiraceae bacterium]